MPYKTLASGQLVYDPYAETDKKMKSTALDNSDEGSCPKCKNQMGTALSGTETVWFCGKCRVSSPLSE